MGNTGQWAGYGTVSGSFIIQYSLPTSIQMLLMRLFVFLLVLVMEILEKRSRNFVSTEQNLGSPVADMHFFQT